MEADCLLKGERARFLTGRLDRGSAEVGMDSGIGSDMLFEVMLTLLEKSDAIELGISRGLNT